MSEEPKRAYKSETRNTQAARTKEQIVQAARALFQTEGFDRVTISMIAEKAQVSMPTVYAIFKSKRGILLSLVDDILPPEKFQALVDGCMAEESPKNRLATTARLARQIYDAEKDLMDILPRASIVAPELKALEHEREMRRYNRQEEYVRKLIAEGHIASELTMEKARDILWALTGRDIYRMLVLERKWTSDEYEQWLSDLLIKSLLQ